MIIPKSLFANLVHKNNCVLFFGTSSLTFGLTLLFLKSWIIQLLTASIVVLKPNNTLETFWRKTPIDVPANVYFFNWTNPEAINDFKIKPQFEQVGPYKFNQKLEKVNVVWNDNNTVTYNQMRTFSYDDQVPNGNLSDTITTINAITLAASHYIQNWNYFIKRGASMVFSAFYPTVSTTRPANQLLLEGYDDVIVNIAKYLPFLASEIPRFDKFGWLHILNGSSVFEGAINIDNGAKGDFEVRNWNYDSKLPQFSGKCAALGQPSAGELYPHKINRTHIDVFVPQVCRSVRFEYEGDVTVDGILGYKFAIGAKFLDNGTTIPENKCYCAGKCIPSGVLNISSCRYGLPAYGSLPHFYQADPYYLEKVDGFKPEKKKHESYLILEPNTGVPLEAVLRFQLNMYLHPIENIMVYENVPQLYFPLFWMETSVTLPNYILTFMKIYLLLEYILLGMSIALIMLGLYVLCFISCKPLFLSMYHKTQFHLIPAEEFPPQCDAEMAYIQKSIGKNEWDKLIVEKFTLR